MKNLLVLFLAVLVSPAVFAADSAWKTSQSCSTIPEELILKLEVEIRAPLAQQLSETLAQCPSLKELVLRLDSPGGSIVETKKIVEVLDQAKARGVNVITRVDNGDECDSNCVPLFAQGDVRQAGSVAAFMFHGVATYMITNVPNALDTEEMLVMIRKGADNQWLRGLQDIGVFSVPGMYWLSGQELVEQKSGLVTELLPRHQKQKPYDRTYRAF